MKCHELLDHQQRWKYDFIRLLQHGRVPQFWLQRNNDIGIIRDWIAQAHHQVYAQSADFEKFCQYFDDLMDVAGQLAEQVNQGIDVAQLKQLMQHFNQSSMRMARGLSKLRHLDKHISEQPQLHDPVKDTAPKPTVGGFLAYLTHKPHSVGEDG